MTLTECRCWKGPFTASSDIRKCWVAHFRVRKETKCHKYMRMWVNLAAFTNHLLPSQFRKKHHMSFIPLAVRRIVPALSLTYIVIHRARAFTHMNNKMEYCTNPLSFSMSHALFWYSDILFTHIGYCWKYFDMSSGHLFSFVWNFLIFVSFLCILYSVYFPEPIQGLSYLHVFKLFYKSVLNISI